MKNENDFTDMYLVAALLAYGFEILQSNRTDINRQSFNFKNEEITVYVVGSDGEVAAEIADLLDIRRYYLAKRLLFPGSYPDILRDLKQEIISYRNDRR